MTGGCPRAELAGQVDLACAGVDRAQSSLHALLEAYDVEYAEGNDGRDLASHLAEAGRRLRAARRIAAAAAYADPTPPTGDTYP